MLDQIKLSDFLSGQSLFTAIKNVNGVTFSFLTPENIPKLDNNLMFNYGERVLFNKMVNMDLSIIAEGVETEAQREWLQKAGVEIVQGFLFDRAMTPETFEARYFSTSDNAENG